MRPIFSLILCFVPAFCTAAEPGGGKKLIEWGWDEPDTAFIRRNIEAMEKYPFDGLVFHLATADGENMVWKMWGSRKFEPDEFAHAVENLRATRFRRFTERFLRVNVTPGDVDWFDDDAWSVVAGNFAVAARIARQGGCRGFMFDVEQYNSAPFDYAAQKHKDTKSFAQYGAQVRRRGREWMQAVNREYPDVTILLTFGYKIAQPPPGKDRSASHYGLLADFLDGMLEACTDETRIVDAWEYSYPYKKPEQFQQAREAIKVQSAEWSAVPEKYRRHVEAGFGIWMDCRWRQVGWNLDDFSKNHFTPAEFQTTVRAALRTADRYVWIYSEQPRWWTNERLPQAYVDALRRARSAD